MRTHNELIDLANASGQKKTQQGLASLIALSILAGMYIAFGAIFYTTVTSYGGHPGLMKIVGGVTFSLGLVLVVLAGAELFTGNSLMVISYLNKRIKFHQLMKNWVIVYLGNFVGALIIALLMFITKQYLKDNSVVGIHALDIAYGKVRLDFSTAFVSAILCNILVCLAVWITMVSKTISGKILGLILPVSAFVAIGLEHSVANMYFIPLGLLIKKLAPLVFWTNIGGNSADFDTLNLSSFLSGNLLPVTLGNIVGGAFFVGAFYWFIYRDESLEN